MLRIFILIFTIVTTTPVKASLEDLPKGICVAFVLGAGLAATSTLVNQHENKNPLLAPRPTDPLTDMKILSHRQKTLSELKSQSDHGRIKNLDALLFLSIRRFAASADLIQDSFAPQEASTIALEKYFERLEFLASDQQTKVSFSDFLKSIEHKERFDVALEKLSLYYEIRFSQYSPKRAFVAWGGNKKQISIVGVVFNRGKGTFHQELSGNELEKEISTVLPQNSLAHPSSAYRLHIVHLDIKGVDESTVTVTEGVAQWIQILSKIKYPEEF